jgi:hypothetical protein
MRDYLTLGCTPYDEPACQVGHASVKMMLLETTAFCRQLKDLLHSHFPEIKVEIKPKREEHDAGSYYEAAVYFDPDNQEEVEQAFWLENNTPELWSENIQHLLKSFGYSLNDNTEPAPFVPEIMRNG